MDMEMTRDQIIQLLNSDINFATEFALENNYNEIAAMYESITHNPVPDEEQLKDYIIRAVETRDPLGQQIMNVSYINDAPNWTAGFGDYFTGNMNFTDPNNPNERSIWGAVLSGVGAFATAWGASMAPPGTSTQTQQQIAAEAERRRREQEEADRKRRNRTIGWVVGIAAAVVIGVLIAVFSGGSKKKPAPAV